MSKLLRLSALVAILLGGFDGPSRSIADEPQSKAPETEAKAQGESEEDAHVPIVRIETSMGTIVCRLFPDAAPKAVENFVGLSQRGYYEDVIFHRVIPEFMIQGGDPTGTGYGGKSIWEIPFEDEFHPDQSFDRPGLLAMANTGRPRTNGSQFFITLKATPWLNDRHTIFGEVIEGMEAVLAIGQVDTGPQDKPIREVKIVKVTVEEARDE